QITDSSKKADNLRLINEMQRGFVTAKGLPLPADVLEHAKDEAGKTKMSEQFRRDLIKALRTSIEIEEDLLVDKNDAAKAKLATIKTMREESHKAMGVKDDEE